MTAAPPRICGLDFTFTLPHGREARRFRRGPSSLYTFREDTRGLARYCSHPDVLLVHRIWPHSRRAFPRRVLKALKSLASTDFATRASGAGGFYPIAMAQAGKGSGWW